jgi:hypothetical protein
VKVTRWLQSAVVTRPDLYRAVYDWNVYPHRWALPVWLEDIEVPATVLSVLERSASGRRRLSRHFVRALGLDATWWDFQEPRRRLVLLSADALARLARFSGAACLGPQLARVVTKDERRAVVARIGEDAYAFGMRRSRMQKTVTPQAAFAGDLGTTIEVTGWHKIWESLRGEDAAVQSRLRLKMPQEIADVLPVAEDRDGGVESSNGETSTEHQPEAREQTWSFLRSVAAEALTPEENRCLT